MVREASEWDKGRSPFRRLCSRRSLKKPLAALATLLLLLCSFLGLWINTRLLSVSASNEDLDPAARLLIEDWIYQGNEGTKRLPLKQPCRYEGHCPIGYTCVAHQESNEGGGVCDRYTLDNGPQLKETHLCIQACMDELKWEDHYQFERRPEPLAFYSATGIGRPDGCRIDYQRVHQAPNEFIDESVYRQWLNEASDHRIVRIDPTYKKDNNVTWSALCFNPCQSNTDCGLGFVCDHGDRTGHNGTCRRDESYWTPTNAQKYDMVLVTGATSDYFLPLKNLAASLCYWAPNHKLVVYNLGLKQSEMDEIRTWSNLLDLKWEDDRPGRKKQYPPHIRLNKQYAWKPIAINESLHEYKAIMWMDAGSSIAGPIDPMIRITRQTGIFLVKGQDTDMSQRSDPRTFEWFNLSETIRTGHYSGNTQAYIYPSRYIDSIVNKAATCAMDRNCIAPIGSTLRKHRYDQTVLSILAYQPDVQVPHHTEYVTCERHQLASSHTEPSYRFIFTARGIESRYLKRNTCNIRK